MMLPTPLASPLNSLVSRSFNTPEEDDETMSNLVPYGSDSPSHPRGPQQPLPSYNAATLSDFSLFSRQRLDRHLEHMHAAPHSSFSSSHVARSPPPGYGQPTPYPSRAEGGSGASWLHPSLAYSGSGYPNSLPSCFRESCLSSYKFLSLPGGQSAASSFSNLEQPQSLHSNPPSTEPRHHTLSPYACSPQGAACCAQCSAGAFARAPKHQAWPHYLPANGGIHPNDCRIPAGAFTHISPVKETQPPHSTPLPPEQRRVFVTYEADNEKHVNEIINFVALLRHNGFDTRIDLFEQQYRSISTIDFMERYLSEKEYLIIIIISPKYYETVTASPVGMENDERTFNTVYIHKQLQNEFIQNGSKNFRFIPILFPGARKCHVPNWLQNTNIFGWPRDRDDILRRLMRVEKYNPPPIGELPTIVSVPIV